MKKSFIIMKLTMTESLRSKVVWAVTAGIIIIFLATGFIENISIGQHEDIIANLGITYITYASILLTIITAAFQITNEIQQNTLHSMLIKPISKTQFLIGKWLGVVGMQTVYVACMTCLLIGYMVATGASIPWLIIPNMAMLIMQIGILAALALAMASFVQPLIAIMGLVAIYFVGNISNTFFLSAIDKENSETIRVVINIIRHIIPNFDRLNLKPYILYQIPAEGIMIPSLMYGVGYIAIALCIASFLFNKAEL